MKLEIAPEIAARFPALRIACLSGAGLRNGPVDAALAAATREQEARTRARFADAAALDGAAEIAAWREVYRAFGANPKRTRPSAEALLRRVVKGDPVPAINQATNAYLLAQLDKLLPVGGYDVRGVKGDVVLRFSPVGERFLPIGAAEPETTDPGEVVYADGEKVLTRRWNFRDCDQAKITETTADLVLFVEAPVETITSGALEQAAAEVERRLREFCGGELSRRSWQVGDGPLALRG